LKLSAHQPSQVAPAAHLPGQEGDNHLVGLASPAVRGNGVTSLERHVGKDGRIVIITIAVAHGVPVPVGIRALIDGPIAVVVDTVTDFVSPGPDAGLSIVAVSRTGCLTVPVEVGGVIDDSRAVVVQAIADLRVSGKDQGAYARRVVAVVVTGSVRPVGTADREAIPILICAVVKQTITVVVDAITQFHVAGSCGCSSRNRVIAVVILGAHEAIGSTGAESVTVLVIGLVDRTTAVVVDTITEFDATRMGQRLRVVAVTPAEQGVRGHALERLTANVAVVVAVLLPVEQQTVAVGIQAIALLHRPREAFGVRVITVFTGRASVSIQVEIAGNPIAIRIFSPTLLLGVRVDLRIPIVAIPSTGAHPIPIHVVVLVGLPVAVVVEPITQLRRIGMYRRIGIVTVASTDSHAIQIVV